MTWNPECVITEHELQIAAAEGNQAGGDAASWVFDGNTTVETAQAWLQGIEDGDPVYMDQIPSPLSGEWAGESIPELSTRFGIDLSNDKIADAFESAYTSGWLDAVEESARHIIGQS